MSALANFAATGDVVTRTAKLYSAILTHNAAATCDIRAGGSGGTVIASLRLPASGTEVWSASGEGVVCPGGIHVTLSGGNVGMEVA
jgi:hypothetical protein